MRSARSVPSTRSTPLIKDAENNVRNSSAVHMMTSSVCGSSSRKVFPFAAEILRERFDFPSPVFPGQRPPGGGYTAEHFPSPAARLLAALNPGTRSVHTVPPVPEGRFPTTHWSQVALAADLDPRVKREALGCLIREYLPAFEAHLRHVLRQPADRADDLLQGFVCDQVVAADLLADADRGRGRFRTFLLTALDRYVARVWRTETAGKR